MKLVFGRLTWDAIPLHEPILLVTFVVVALGGVAMVAALTYFRLWGPLWRDWITSIDHKKIGIMYIILGLVMLLRGFADAIMMRAAAGDRLRRRSGLSAAAPLRPDLHRPRRHHDLLRRDAARHRAS